MTEDCKEIQLPLLKNAATTAQSSTSLLTTCSRKPANSLITPAAATTIENVPDDCLRETKDSFRYQVKPFKQKESFSLIHSDNLSVDDLKKLQDWLLLQICSTSDLLVELLQERQRLSEEVHARLISIEQLHRLLEARCYYRGLSTGLFS